jgi:hypothetical protein
MNKIIRVPLSVFAWASKYRVLIGKWEDIKPYATEHAMSKNMLVEGKYHSINFVFVDNQSKTRDKSCGQLYQSQGAPDGYQDISIWYYPYGWPSDQATKVMTGK